MIARWTRVQGDLAEGLPTISGAEYAVQKIKQKLRFFLGEWFLDQGLGMPWFEEILVKNPNYEFIRGRIRAEILSVEGITQVKQINVSEPDGNRVAAVDFVAVYKDGTEVLGTSGVQLA